MPSFTYREHSPMVELSPFVECFWSVEASAVINTGVPPDGCVDIVFSPGFGLRVVGAMTTEQRFTLDAGAQTVGVRFRPGMARAILRISPAEFTDTFVEIQDLWPQRGKELLTQLGELQSASHRIAALHQAVKLPEAVINPVERAIQTICLTHGNVNLDDLASQANLSPRQFRRRCHEEAGLTPKHLCRILRFRRARQLARLSPKTNWAKIAAEAGYFDQAHLIRDFHEFTGRTPMSVLSNTRAATLA